MIEQTSIIIRSIASKPMGMTSTYGVPNLSLQYSAALRPKSLSTTMFNSADGIFSISSTDEPAHRTHPTLMPQSDRMRSSSLISSSKFKCQIESPKMLTVPFSFLSATANESIILTVISLNPFCIEAEKSFDSTVTVGMSDLQTERSSPVRVAPGEFTTPIIFGACPTAME